MIGRVGVWLGPVAFAAVLLLTADMSPAASRTAALATWMAVWWMTEAVPVPVTALLPVALIPVLGIADIRSAAAPFAHPVIFLFLGGFLMAAAVQRWNLHRRLALNLLTRTGTGSVRMVGGFMVVTAGLSMWVSNTATVIMMLPIAASVISLARPEPANATAAPPSRFAICLMLGLAYAASIGGVGTVIGTPPNALFSAFVRDTYGMTIGFAEWMLIGVPIVAVSLPIAWWMLTRWLYPPEFQRVAEGPDAISQRLRALGPRTAAETRVLIVFTTAAAAWVLRPFLTIVVPGLSDAGIAIAAAALLFVLPAGSGDRRRLLNWESACGIPWDILILFGGGLSLAAAINDSGLALWIGQSLAWAGGLPVLVVLAVVTACMVFLTELTSNTASTATFLPVIGALAVGIGQDPVLLLLPVTLAASCAFMLPVATPPNAIVYSSGQVLMKHMLRAGLAMNVICCALIPPYVWVMQRWIPG